MIWEDMSYNQLDFPFALQIEKEEEETNEYPVEVEEDNWWIWHTNNLLIIYYKLVVDLNGTKKMPEKWKKLGLKWYEE